MSSSESLNTGNSHNSSDEWARQFGTYEQNDGAYRAGEATRTGETFAVPIETGFSFLDGQAEE